MAQGLTAAEKDKLVVMYAIIETIMDTPEGCPSGIIFAAVTGRIEYDEYARLIANLKARGWVKDTAHLLTWTGPDLRADPQ